MTKNSENRALKIVDERTALEIPGGPLPTKIIEYGEPAQIAWDDFFAGSIANPHTRLAYERAVRYFLIV